MHFLINSKISFMKYFFHIKKGKQLKKLKVVSNHMNFSKFQEKFIMKTP